MRLLITGADGLLGQDVAAAAGAAGHDVVALSRASLDVTDFDAVQRAFGEAQPEVVINCAAWTNVDGAEAAEVEATAVNGTGAGNVARAAVGEGAWTIHVSSDYVFDGAKREPYLESDIARPLSAYGRSKLAGEIEVAEGAPGRHTVVRSAWLFGAGGPCFPATILRLAAERDELSVVDDQVGSPTFAGHLASALLSIAESVSRPLGLAHVAGSEACSWFELARALVELRGLHCAVRPIPTEDTARPATRPAYSVLGSERSSELPALPGWREGLADYLVAAGAPTA